MQFYSEYIKCISISLSSLKNVTHIRYFISYIIRESKKRKRKCFRDAGLTKSRFTSNTIISRQFRNLRCYHIYISGSYGIPFTCCFNTALEKANWNIYLLHRIRCATDEKIPCPREDSRANVH